MSIKKELQFLLVDDEEIIHQSLGKYLKSAGHQLDGQYRGKAALKRLQQNEYDIAIIDIRMPDMDGLSLLREIKKSHPIMPVIMITALASMEMVLEALRSGATDFLTKPVKLLELDAVIEKCLHIRYLLHENKSLHENINRIRSVYDRRIGQNALVGISDETQQIRTQIKEAADSGVDPILITGETGAGKEVVAQQFHREASSENTPFIAVNCPSLPESLLEREMFGHDKGAFTDATQDTPGFFELAEGGTLFLDEIGDLSPAAQASLLRVIETRTFRRLGGKKELQVDLRLVAATNAPLDENVQNGKFRIDLFYRLNLYTIAIPPLRDRRQDIIPIAEHLLSEFTTQRNISISGFTEDAQNSLMKYDYPGNVRELRNIVERAAILCRSGHIDSRHLNLPQSQNTPEFSHSAREATSNDERDRIIQALEEVKWNRQKAAEILGMPYSTLRYKIKTLGIS